jgi:hypothetical protein
MPDQPKRKLDVKSQKILDKLKACNAELGGPGYKPNGFEEEHEPPLEHTSAPRFGRLPLVSNNELLRLKAWLTEVADAYNPTCFSALLQVWLDSHGIAWPRGVFKEDLALPGSGLIASELGREAHRLREKGKSWGWIAERLIGEECSTPGERRDASSKVRLAAKNYVNGKQRDAPLAGSVAEFAWMMLDVKPRWKHAEEYAEEMQRLDAEEREPTAG